MYKIFHIALNTFRESVRDRVLYVIAFFSLMLMAASQGLGWVSVGEQVQIVKHFSLAAVSFFGALIAVFVGTGLIYKEIDKRTIYTVLSKPVYRWQFIFGKFFGLMAVLLFVVSGMGLIACGFVRYSGGEINAIYIQALVLLYFELMVVTAIAIFFSTVSTPILAAIFTFCSYLVGQVTPSLMELVEFKKPEINYHLRTEDVTDWPGLCKTLKSGLQKPAPNPYHRVWSLFGPAARAVTEKAVGGGKLSRTEKRNMLRVLNTILERRDFYRKACFKDCRLSEKARQLLGRDSAEISDHDMVRRNRFLLEAAFPGQLAKRAEVDTVAQFTKEHLTDMVSRSHWLLKPFSLVMYHALPNLTHFQLRNRVVYGPPLRRGKGVMDDEFSQAIIYGLAYSAAMLLLASLLFDRKRF